jgi:hypothetical protein
MSETVDVWEGDKFDRETSARMLHALVLQKFKEEQYNSIEALCFSVDGDWGAGKSYFLKRWAQDLRNQQHAVIEFDAWANDLSEEPLLGFLAELRDGLTQLAHGTPLATDAKAKVASVFRGLRHAIVPATGAALKALTSRYFSSEAVDLISGKTADLGAPTKEQLEAGLDKLFDEALKEHKEVKELVSDMKQRLQTLLQDLSQQQKIHLPLFVIIDELDRCRPSYAIRLLEGIKHLFGAPNVCFVVSTNLAQMAESVRAVYGSGFDGQRYLKRFLAFEFKLPTISTLEFCKSIISSSSPFSQGRSAFGLPEPIERFGQSILLPEVLSTIASAFELSPRCIKQVNFVAEAAALSVKSKIPVHVTYLYFLAALQHRSPAAFHELIKGADKSANVFMDVLRGVGYKRDEYVINGKSVNLTEVFKAYWLYERVPLHELRRLVNSSWSSETGGYTGAPQSLHRLLDEGQTEILASSRPTSINSYPQLILSAGCLAV